MSQPSISTRLISQTAPTRLAVAQWMYTGELAGSVTAARNASAAAALGAWLFRGTWMYFRPAASAAAFDSLDVGARFVGLPQVDHGRKPFRLQRGKGV